jgi:hypothetical protein
MKDREGDVPLDRKTVQRLVDQYRWDEWTDMGGFSEREEEEFLLRFGPKKVRRAIKESREAREQAQKNE